MRFTFVLLTFAFTSSASGIDYMMLDVEDNQPPAAEPKESPSNQRPVVLTSCSTSPTGYVFAYSNGGVIEETFAQYVARTGKRPPEAQPTCATGYCGTFTGRVTLPTSGCTCGCGASSCNCFHAPNEGKPLTQQRMNEPRVPAATGMEQQGISSTATRASRPFLRRLFRR